MTMTIETHIAEARTELGSTFERLLAGLTTDRPGDEPEDVLAELHDVWTHARAPFVAGRDGSV